MIKQLFAGGTMLVATATLTLMAADAQSDDDSGDLYRARELSLDAFGTASLGKISIENLSGSRVEHDTRLGAGLGLSYFMTRNLGIGADAYSENTSGAFVDSASASLMLRLPLGQSGFAPYALGGGGRQFDLAKLWFAQLGAGIEYRFTPQIAAFADARWVLPEKTSYYGVARFGLRFPF